MFLKDSEPILTCILENALFFEPVALEPEKTSLDDARSGFCLGTEYQDSGPKRHNAVSVRLQTCSLKTALRKVVFGYRLSSANILATIKTNKSGPIQLLPASLQPFFR